MRRVLFALVLVLGVLVGSFGSLSAAPAPVPAAATSLSSEEDGHQPWVEETRWIVQERFEHLCPRCDNFAEPFIDGPYWQDEGYWALTLSWSAGDPALIKRPGSLPNLRIPDAVPYLVIYYQKRTWQEAEGCGSTGFRNVRYLILDFDIYPADLNR